MRPHPAAYEERYRWTPTVVFGLLVCAAFVVGGVLSSMSLVLRVLITAPGAFGAFNCITYPASRKVVFRADPEGVTLGGSPFRYQATTRFFPWAEIEKIVLWQRAIPLTVGRWTLFSLGPLRYVGVARRPGILPYPVAGPGWLTDPLAITALPSSPHAGHRGRSHAHC